MIEFSKSLHADKVKSVIIYPAGKAGKIIFEMLKFIGVEVKYFCDQNLSGKYCEIDIIPPEKMMELYGDCDIVISSSGHYFELMKYLNENDIKNVYDVCDLVNDVNIRSNIIENDESYINIMDSYKNILEYYKSEGLNWPSLDLVITEKCSLKCEKCSNLMQYYQKPENYKIEEITKSVDNILECIDTIKELRLIGGEPFMNKELYKVIDLYSEEKKIESIIIFTNGTIIPDERNMESLKNKKIKLYITDYGKLSKNINELIKKLKDKNINYFLNKLEKWNLFPELKERKCSNEQIKQMYVECCCKTLLTVIKGKLFCCPFLANAENIKAIPSFENEYVDCNGNDIDINDLKGKIKFMLFEKEYFKGCSYCGGRTGQEVQIEPAVQINNPLEYVRY